MEFTEYIAQIKQQQLNNPTRSKYYPGLGPISFLPVSQALREVRFEAYEYTGVRKIDSYETVHSSGLYNNITYIDDIFYSSNKTESSAYVLEFVNISSQISNYRYLYLPLISSIIEEIKGKLPYTINWNPDTVYTQYPVYSLANTSFAILNMAYYNVVEEGKHPFHPGFSFTGKVSHNSEGKLLYEYVDNKGYYGYPSDLYLSDLRPIDLNLPLGNLREIDIQRDDCIPVGVTPPSGVAPLLGTSTGYVTTRFYDPRNTYVVYEDSSGYILLYPKESFNQSSSSTANSALIQFNRNDIPINFIPVPSQATIFITQNSTASSINLYNT